MVKCHYRNSEKGLQEETDEDRQKSCRNHLQIVYDRDIDDYIVLSSNYRIVNSMLGGFDRYADNSGINSDGVDTQYNKADYTKTELASAGKKLGEMVGGKGIVLLKNDEKSLPLKEGTTLSLVSANNVDLQAATSMTGGISVKDILQSSGFKINDTLWKFYSKGAGKNYGLAKGSISYGDAEDFVINECPLSVMKDSDGILDSMKGTKVIYVMKCVAGEGRDMPRSMYNHTDIEAD